ncbi:SnoaL-like protein [Humibacillus xanthopallidus]|uniref:SnoaL-like protein n=1 Tax=Humibacillus xanthopallidus TaxID=412689 RepID=A0A543PRV7_9MICO|nr:nuclear transport factor 2 family protein [Humibacillus xanthopallidus]TQN46813.1 SnoaL-like protein [Humibacillus xanthopallidus]
MTDPHVDPATPAPQANSSFAPLTRRVAELLAKQDVHDLLATYLRAVDRGDVEGAAACYLPGATEDHGGVFDGPAADYLRSIEGTLTHPKALTTHALTNVLVDVTLGEDLESGHARAESYVLAFARVRRPDGVVGDTLTGARMVDDLELHDGRWGIRHRALRWDWNHDMDRSETWVYGMLVDDPARLRRSEKFPHDVVYAERSAGVPA